MNEPINKLRLDGGGGTMAIVKGCSRGAIATVDLFVTVFLLQLYHVNTYIESRTTYLLQ